MQELERLRAVISERGSDPDEIVERLKRQRIETPSWGYGDSGTRFGVFQQTGVPRDPFEKLQDAAVVHSHTGIAPSVAIHIPWDRVDDFSELKTYAESLGVEIGAVNPNLFQDEDYRLGSLCHPNAEVRRKATDHMLECVGIADELGSGVISLWLADGTNYAGQDSFTDRRLRLDESLSEVYAAMPDAMRLFVEYKFFEPAFYHTDLPDWGTALLTCQRLGERAQVLVDLGHHAQGVNIEHIVALLAAEGRLGGFHFNNRKYADDDLIVGSVNPFELFLIYVELARIEELNQPFGIEYMIDQSHNIEPKIEAMILSVMNLQEAFAKALIVDRDALAARRAEGDVLGAHRVLLDAFATDVRPLCAAVRAELGADEDPLGAFRGSGYTRKVTEERGKGSGVGWN